MSDAAQKKRRMIFYLFTVLAGLLIAASYFSPIWWVSIKAHQYPPDRWPVGVKILFYANSVQNGCPKLHSEEVAEDEGEGMDCVEEMNTINHFIGMEPMAAGGQKEMAFAPYGFIGTLVMLFIALFYKKRFWSLLLLPGIIMPIAFVVDYSAWLWWFGHNLKPWGAFTVKPFMPTVLGQSKVAQFFTYSYPDKGFIMLVVAALLLVFAMLVRRKELKEDKGRN